MRWLGKRGNWSRRVSKARGKILIRALVSDGRRVEVVEKRTDP